MFSCVLHRFPLEYVAIQNCSPYPFVSETEHLYPFVHEILFLWFPEDTGNMDWSWTVPTYEVYLNSFLLQWEIFKTFQTPLLAFLFLIVLLFIFLSLLELDPCSTNPCQFGGTCFVVGLSFQCTCRPGFTGNICENGGSNFLSKNSSIPSVNMFHRYFHKTLKTKK